MLPKYILLCIAVVLSAILSTSSARKLNIAQFDHLLKEKGRYLFVFFYSESQCLNCPEYLENAWSKLEQNIVAFPASRLVIGEVNCDSEVELCAREEVFSTFKYEEGLPQHFPFMKLYVRRDDAMLKMLLMKNLLLQLHGLEDDEEEVVVKEPTEFVYNMKSIDLSSLELFLRRKLPKEAIEGPAEKTASIFDATKDEESDIKPNIPMTSSQKKMAAIVKATNRAHNFLELDDDDFALYLSYGENIVFVYNPSCKQCHGLMAKWELLFSSLDLSSVRMLSINCADSPMACNYYDIEADAVYPTILWVSEGSLQQKFENLGKLSLADFMATFRQLLEKIDERVLLKTANGGEDATKVSKKKKKKKKKGSVKISKIEPTLVLNADDFDSEVKRGQEGKEGERIFFVHYTVPWSRHCSRMAADWRTLQKKLAQQNEQLKSAVKLARVDCSVNERLCNDEQIDGYPTLYLYRNGKRVEEYEGSRTAASFLAYLKQHFLEESQGGTSSSSSSHHLTDEL